MAPSIEKNLYLGGGVVVSALAFYSNDTSSKLNEAYSFCLNWTKINEKGAAGGPFKIIL